MKNVFKFFVPMAAAVIAFASCQQEDINNGNAISIKVHAIPDEVQVDAEDADVKTYIDGSAIKWGSGEYMKLCVTAGENSVFANSLDASANWNGATVAHFQFSVDPGSASSYIYQGLYPASVAVANNNANPANYKVNLPSTQNATASSYDPSAYILVAKPEEFDAVESDWQAAFRRATALNKVTLKNIPNGVSIKRVTITAPTGKYLAGARHINLTTGLSDDIYFGGGRTETVEVKYATPLSGSGEGTWNADIWFTSWDVEVAESETLTIVAYTSNQKSYTKEITVPSGKSIKFQEGCLNTLGAKMNEGTVIGDVTELEEGDYVVLAKDGDNYYALKAEKEDGKERLLSVAYEGSLDSYLGDADMIWTLTKSGDSFIFENDSKYLGYKGSGNESYWLVADENWTETNYLLDVTAQETAGLYYVTLHSNSAKYLSKNSSGAFFAFYGNTGQKADIVFVPATLDTRTPVTLTFAEGSLALTKGSTEYNDFAGQDVTASPDVTAITDNLNWSYANTDGVIDENNSSDYAIALSGETGTATVTVTFNGDATYRPAEASYTITVSASSTITLTASDITAGDYTAQGTENGILAYRLGTSDNNGSVSFEAGYASITFRLEPYSNTPRTFSVTNGTINGESSLSPSAGSPSGTINAGFSRTDTGTEYTIVVTDPSQGVVLSGRRGIVWGFTATAGSSVTWNLESIAITTHPTKTVYTEGESFDPAGMVVTGHFVDADDNTNTKDEAVTGYTISPDGALSTSDDHVTITYQGQTANQSITVNAAATPTYDFETVAELNALVTSSGDSSKNNDAVEYNGKLTSAVVSFVPNASNAIIKDATGSVLVFKSNHGLLQGQTFTGDVTVTAKLYYTTVEITAIDASFSGSQTEVLPVTMTLSQLEGNFSTYQNAYVKVEGLTVTARDEKNISVSDGTKTYVIYDNANTSTAAVNDVITAVGTVADHNGTNQIKVWSSSDITVTASAPKAITFTQPASGGSFTVSVGGSTITSGTTVPSGTTVTLTATASSNYSFSSWTVSGATVADASAATTTFTMGTSAVTVSASFTSTGGGTPTEQTIFLETFGSTSSNTAIASYNGYSATTSMFSTEGTVKSHYSGSGSVGKNNLSAANLSSGYTDASGLSGCYHGGTANTTATILQIANINISGCVAGSDLTVSFGALGGSTSHKVNVSYIIDNGSETSLITNGSITNSSWTLLDESITIPSGGGTSLTLIFKHTPTKAWTIRLDDIKVVGTR